MKPQHHFAQSGWVYSAYIIYFLLQLYYTSGLFDCTSLNFFPDVRSVELDIYNKEVHIGQFRRKFGVLDKFSYFFLFTSCI